jgi:hypothetical protein
MLLDWRVEELTCSFPTCLNQGKQTSTKSQGRKRAHSKTTVPTTTRTTSASTSRLNQTDQSPPNNNETSPYQNSNDSNSPQADIEMPQDMTDTSRQTDNIVTLRGQGICNIS